VNEEPLPGGNMNSVVRSGDTVRRRASAATATIHRLLSHARAAGVTWVPEPRGFDERGREILSFIEGEVPHAMPAWLWSDAVLTDVARALRQWHDATATFERAGAVWSLDAREPEEVICHADFAPYNCVFRGERFVGAIDFDLCAPGPRLWDLAYTAYRFVPLMPPRDATVPDARQERSPFGVLEMTRRLDLFLSTYAGGDPSFHYGRAALLHAVVERLGAIATWTTEHVARTGQRDLASHATMYRAHAAWLDAELRRVLTDGPR
jgi:aminoglycoside phosphotransferase (APT) family kinase protein